MWRDSWSTLWLVEDSSLKESVRLNPSDLNSSMKSISLPVKALKYLGQTRLHCGQEQLSMKWNLQYFPCGNFDLLFQLLLLLCLWRWCFLFRFLRLWTDEDGDEDGDKDEDGDDDGDKDEDDGLLVVLLVTSFSSINLIWICLPFVSDEEEDLKEEGKEKWRGGELKIGTESSDCVDNSFPAWLLDWLLINPGVINSLPLINPGLVNPGLINRLSFTLFILFTSILLSLWLWLFSVMIPLNLLSLTLNEADLFDVNEDVINNWCLRRRLLLSVDSSSQHRSASGSVTRLILICVQVL